MADIAAIKRKLLVKYPFFGSVIANVKYEETNKIQTAGTDGKTIYYNPDFTNKLLDAYKSRIKRSKSSAFPSFPCIFLKRRERDNVTAERLRLTNVAISLVGMDILMRQQMFSSIVEILGQ